MEFEEFKGKITEGLQKIYGDNAELDTGVIIKNNGSKYNGIRIELKDLECRTDPIIELDSIYAAFENGKRSLEDCVRDIYRKRAAFRNPEEIEQFAERAMEWELVRNKIYPVLLSTEDNQEILKDLVSTSMLDLSVIYIVRGQLSARCATSIKITHGLLKYYGISTEKLHDQAMENLEKDGYEFQDLESMVMQMRYIEAAENDNDEEDHKPEIYVLTNASKSYGAAGILNRKLLREFAGGRDFIILPSSIHETLFIPVTDETDQEFFDEMVSEVNRTQVSLEERLADHSYYYDAGIGEIRMCA